MGRFQWESQSVARGELLGARGRTSLLWHLHVCVLCETVSERAQGKYRLERENKKTIRKVINIMLIYYCTVAQNHRLSTKSSPPFSQLQTKPPCVEL